MHIVAIAIDKVQTFLYYAIHAHVQEKQTNSGTLSSIIGASRMISEDFFSELGVSGEKGLFSGQVEEVLLQCSGTCIFVTQLEKEIILDRLNKLFQNYYRWMEGQLFLRYVCFKHPITSEKSRLETVKKGKHLLKERDCLNRIIEENQEVLFQFQTQEKEFHFKKEKAIHPVFTETINKLYKEEPGGNEKYFRIAVIKADLDGMGALFESMDSYEHYRKISDILSGQVCLEGLKLQAEKLYKENSNFRLYPLYVAGDDIMFAVKTEDIVSGIELCRRIVDNINKQIEQDSQGDSRDKTGHISMSIGIDFTWNREPIRYYYERVQEQLEYAKKVKRYNAAGQEEPMLKIGINHSVFCHSVDKNQRMKTIYGLPRWRDFIRNLEMLDQMKAKGFKVHHFLYGLLEKLTDPMIRKNVRKRSNAILYHLLPQYMESPGKELREYELRLIEILLERITVKTEMVEGQANTTCRKLQFGETQCKNLETYVRLLLVFSDARFQVEKSKPSHGDCRKEFTERDIKRVKKAVFNRTRDYLYDNNLYSLLFQENNTWKKQQAKQLRRIFVRKDEEENQKSCCYQTLSLSHTSFFRMKNSKADVEGAAKIIAAINGRDEEAYKELAEARKEEHKPLPDLGFSEERFLETAQTSGLWKEDYIDSLLIFYRFQEIMQCYLRKYPKKKGKNRQGEVRNGENKAKSYHKV